MNIFSFSQFKINPVLRVRHRWGEDIDFEIDLRKKILIFNCSFCFKSKCSMSWKTNSCVFLSQRVLSILSDIDRIWILHQIKFRKDINCDSIREIIFGSKYLCDSVFDYIIKKDIKNGNE